MLINKSCWTYCFVFKDLVGLFWVNSYFLLLLKGFFCRQVSSSLTAPPSATVIEANGKLLLPAGIDVHTHFSAPNCVDNFEVGSKAALAGGTATVFF